jgi:hypothetical protein
MPTFPTMRRVLLAVAMLAVTGVLTACGVSSTVDPVAAAATKTEKAGGYHVEINSTVTSGGIDVRIHGQGSFDDNGGELDMDMSQTFKSLSTPPAAEMTMKTVYLIEDGDPVMYMKFGGLPMPGGKSWVRVDLEKAGKAMGVDFSQLMSGANQNPTQSLDMLKGAGDFTRVGTDDLQGVETTHYHGTVDLQKAAGSHNAAAAGIQSLIDLGAPSQYPVDVWIDAAGYIRQYQTVFNETSNGKATTVAMTMDISDYGTAVNVSAPPADQVLDVTDQAAKTLQSQLSSGTS